MLYSRAVNPAKLKQLLDEVAAGTTGTDAALERLRNLPFEGVDELATLDHHRTLRTGIPEVVYGYSKTGEQIAEIMDRLDTDGAGALATGVDAAKAALVTGRLSRVRYEEMAKCLVIDPTDPVQRGVGTIAVVSAGTSDEPVAAEAAVTLEFLGHRIDRMTDIGVAGLQRVLGKVERLQAANALIVVAGMEGALPTVVAGLVSRPVIAVPTSVGYGVSLGGYAAMLTMLSSCSAGVTVVNIDNGFGAAVAAAQINQRPLASASADVDA